MADEETPQWRQLVGAVAVYATAAVVAQQVYQQYLVSLDWITDGDQTLALRVVEIVAVLLPLVAIFFQILFRQADSPDSTLHTRADELVPPLLITFLGLLVAGAASTLVVLFGGIGAGVGVALVGLLGALSGLLIVVVSFTTVVREEYGLDTQQQQLGDSTPKLSTTADSAEENQ